MRARQTDLAGNIDDGGAYRGLTIFSTGANDDGDSEPDGCDNCPHVFNTQSFNVDGDGLGDACDADNATPQSIVKFYPISNAITEFTNDGWINSGLVVSGGRLIPLQSVGTLSKTFPTAVIGEVVLGDYAVTGAPAEALQISLSTDQSAVPSCRLERNGEQNVVMSYLVNEVVMDSTSTTMDGALSQRVGSGSHRNICEAGGQTLDEAATQGNNNFATVIIDLHHASVSIDQWFDSLGARRNLAFFMIEDVDSDLAIGS